MLEALYGTTQRIGAAACRSIQKSTSVSITVCWRLEVTVAFSVTVDLISSKLGEVKICVVDEK